MKSSSQKKSQVQIKNIINKGDFFDVNKDMKSASAGDYVTARSKSKWDELVEKAQINQYVVQEGDDLKKISEKLFGSPKFYSKLWSLNPHITNPYDLKKGTVLSLVGQKPKELPKITRGTGTYGDFGEGIDAPWLKEREKLISEGVYFQLASEASYDDLKKLGKKNLSQEYKHYQPPYSEILTKEIVGDINDLGFDKRSIVKLNFEEGFYLSSFISTNPVQDLGVVEAIQDEKSFISQYDKVYVKFNEDIKPEPGQRFSLYKYEGGKSHPISDRKGKRYSIVGHIKVLGFKRNRWECEVYYQTDLLKRGERITRFTPKINKILRTFNRQIIEAAVIDAYQTRTTGYSLGDVVYLDRGRNDGLELGNVLNTYSFVDRGTGKRITLDPTYKTGELTIITLTDDFSTALITQSSRPVKLGTLAVTKDSEKAKLEGRAKRLAKGVEADKVQKLKDLELEFELDDASKELMNKANKIKLSEDEVVQLEKGKLKADVISDIDKDLKDLEALESELSEAENLLSEHTKDEDELLEKSDLEKIESKRVGKNPDAFESMEEAEKEIGKKYMDEDINDKENPFGLSENDVEEIDELLNTDL